jgi:hypothetical protein
MSKSVLTLAFLALACAASQVQALTYPYTENFTSGHANWTNNANGFAIHSSSGGPDGSGYISTSFNFQNTTPTSQDPVVLRGQNSTPLGAASSGAFMGNWLAAGVKEFSGYVRHNASIPLTFYARVAQSPFPGLIYEQPNLVQPNTWTHIQFAVNAQNPYLFDEGVPYAGVMNNIARVQFGVAIPPSFVGQNISVTFDLDQATISVPEPSTMLMGSCAAMVLSCFRRRSR